MDARTPCMADRVLEFAGANPQKSGSGHLLDSILHCPCFHIPFSGLDPATSTILLCIILFSTTHELSMMHSWYSHSDCKPELYALLLYISSPTSTITLISKSEFYAHFNIDVYEAKEALLKLDRDPNDVSSHIPRFRAHYHVDHQDPSPTNGCEALWSF